MRRSIGCLLWTYACIVCISIRWVGDCYGGQPEDFWTTCAGVWKVDETTAIFQDGARVVDQPVDSYFCISPSGLIGFNGDVVVTSDYRVVASDTRSGWNCSLLTPLSGNLAGKTFSLAANSSRQANSGLVMRFARYRERSNDFQLDSMEMTTHRVVPERVHAFTERLVRRANLPNATLESRRLLVELQRLAVNSDGLAGNSDVHTRASSGDVKK